VGKERGGEDKKLGIRMKGRERRRG